MIEARRSVIQRTKLVESPVLGVEDDCSDLLSALLAEDEALVEPVSAAEDSTGAAA